MEKKEFTQATLRVAEVFGDIVAPTKKGEHCYGLLGWARFPGTARHAEFVWRKYGLLDNLVLLCTAEEANARLQKTGIDSFRAYKTKSGRFCRLSNKITREGETLPPK